MTTMFLTDVYSNPDEYVSSLKKKGFEDFNDGVNVFKNVQKLERDDVAKSIESLINAELVLSFARMSVLGQEEPNFIHKDDMHGDYTAIIYLNKKYPSEYGTTLYDEDNKEILVCKAKYNSVFIFPSHIKHSRNCFHNFGEGDNARLVQVMFLKLKNGH
ncbi:MAG: hypothetical protein GOVbin962_51 [Prokaryotic dsDNA virus sp.]|nr:MAG: hypothetical protein GOVbin962_51 [Prokaryotic dsDNA virus sp.]|tara:strand:+ start:56152 stop:56628 length:477 start_codon:yes stop_codon:yes gene_type:complete